MTYQSSLHDTQRAFSWSRVRRQVYGDAPVMVRISGEPTTGERINTAAFAVQEEARKATTQTPLNAAGALADLCAEVRSAYDAGLAIEVSAGKGKLMWVVCIRVASLPYFVKGLTQQNAAFVVGAIRRTFAGLPAQPAEVTA